MVSKMSSATVITPTNVAAATESPTSPVPSSTPPAPTSGKNTTSATASDKLCAVCGDRALGYNFNAVTCESCKAFFRRNALATKPMQCPFSERCDITVVTRRFCQRCRLRKCFAAGMRKEYIMSEADKQLKKIKIEQNRSKRKPASSTSDDDNDEGGGGGCAVRVKKLMPAKIKREVASLMRADDEDGAASSSSMPETAVGKMTTMMPASATVLMSTPVENTPANAALATSMTSALAELVGVAAVDQMTGGAGSKSAGHHIPPHMSPHISSSGDSTGSPQSAASTTVMPTLASSSTDIVDRLVNYPEDASKLINHLMRTPHDAVLVMTKIIHSQKDAMRLIGHLIGAPGDALKIISKIMNSPFDALTVFTKFMSSPTDALEIIAKIASSPEEVLQFIQQLMNAPEDALQIMNKFMNSPAEALKMLNKMVNNPTADSTTPAAVAAVPVAVPVPVPAQKVTQPTPGQTDQTGGGENLVMKSMFEELQTSQTTVLPTEDDILPASQEQTIPASTMSCNQQPAPTDKESILNLQHSLQPDGSGSTSIGSESGNDTIREILAAAIDAPIGVDTLESVICDVIGMEYDLAETATVTSAGRELNDAERAKLNELIVANKAMYAPLDEDMTAGLDECSGDTNRYPQDPQLLKIINLTAIAILRLIKMSKKINAFRNMCQADQVAALKGGCTEMMILRSAMQYDSTKAKWQVPNSQEAMSLITVDVLKLAKGNVYAMHDEFIRTFEPKWRQDENIILILSAIMLFSADRPRAVHTDVLRLEQHSYYYLLRRYLESVYGGCEAKSTYLKLVQKVRDVQRLSDEFVGVYLDVNPKQVEPLLWEMFDMTNH